MLVFIFKIITVKVNTVRSHLYVSFLKMALKSTVYGVSIEKCLDNKNGFEEYSVWGVN